MASAKSVTKRRKRLGAPKVISVASVLRRHFQLPELHRLVTASRAFPITARVDLQSALIELIAERLTVTHQSGVQAGHAFQTFTFSMLSVDRDYAPVIAPVENEDVDVGEAVPVRCLRSTLWLCREKSRACAMLLTPSIDHGRISGWQVELATLPDPRHEDGTREFLELLERKTSRAQSYRGKVISLEERDNYSGKAGSVRVHKLRTVSRDQVILPAKTLDLLERNVTEFIEQRDRLTALGMGIKKGLLLYGPPGTGKTHTIHYLASRLKDHTTLLITAE